jgi:hypothetical protein
MCDSRRRRIGLFILAALIIIVPVSCTGVGYHWGGFEPSVRRMLVQSHTFKAETELRRLVREIDFAERHERRVPPGEYLHVGYLHSIVGDVASAREFLVKEKTAYPEASRLVDGLLERMQQE